MTELNLPSMANRQSPSVSARTAMESAVYNMENVTEHSRSPSPPLPPNVLQPERDFILTFERLTELWDTSNPQYTNKYKRNENLAMLLPILKKIKPNACLEDVKKKINSIRSNYRRELKKIAASKQPGADTYTPKIWYFPYMHFLRRLEQESDPTKQEDHLASPNSKVQQEIKHNDQSMMAPQKRRSFSVNRKMKKKNINHGDLVDGSCPCHAFSQSIHIAIEWSNTLDKLDPLQRLYAKKAINDILFEAELGNLNKV